MSVYAIQVFLIWWTVCGFLATGLEFAFYQKAYPTIAAAGYKRDMIHAYLYGLLGIVALLLIVTNLRRLQCVVRYGFKYW